MLVLLTKYSGWEVLVNLEYLVCAEQISYYDPSSGVKYATRLTLSKSDTETVTIDVNESTSGIYRMMRELKND